MVRNLAHEKSKVLGSDMGRCLDQTLGTVLLRCWLFSFVGLLFNLE